MEDLKIVDAAVAKADLVALINEVADMHQPVLITGRKGNVVLVGEEDWDLIQAKISQPIAKNT